MSHNSGAPVQRRATQPRPCARADTTRPATANYPPGLQRVQHDFHPITMCISHHHIITYYIARTDRADGCSVTRHWKMSMLFTSCLALGRATSSPFGRKQRNTQTRTKTLSSPDIGLSFCFAAFHANNNNLRPPGAYRAMSHGACCLLWRCIAFSSTIRVQYDHSSVGVFCVVSDD